MMNSSSGFTRGRLGVALCALAFGMTLSAGSVTAAELRVNVTGLESHQGQLIINVYSEQDDWLSLDEGDQTQQVIVDLAKQDSVERITHIFELPEGVYAATAVHDVDASGDLRRNWIGIPKEPVGESGNQKNKMGPPKYKKSKFSLGADPLEKTIELKSY